MRTEITTRSEFSNIGRTYADQMFESEAKNESNRTDLRSDLNKAIRDLEKF